MSKALIKRDGPVVARCLSCQFEAVGKTWRPIRRELAEHVAHNCVRRAGRSCLRIARRRTDSW